MSLAFFDFQTRRQHRRPGSCRIHDYAACDRRSVAQTHVIGAHGFNRLPDEKLRAARSRLVHKKLRRTRRIDHAVARPTQPADESRTQTRLGLAQCLRIKQLNYHTALGIKSRLPFGFGHLFVVSGDPDRAARIVLDFARQLTADLVPKLLRITSERKLRLRIVHHDEMAHARRSRAAADDSRFDDRDTQSRARALRRAGRSDDSSADDHDVVAHLRMPIANGSRSSRIKSDSAVMKADPLILGWTTLSITFTRPSKTLPTMLSCRHTSPALSFPSANRHASFALVPVPQGERSYALPGQSTKFLLSTPASCEGAKSST